MRACLEVSLPAPIEYYRTMARSVLSGPPARAAVVPVPTLVLHGERDGCVGAGLGKGQERFFTGAFEAEVLPEVGHFLHLERPAVVAERVLSWFRA